MLSVLHFKIILAGRNLELWDRAVRTPFVLDVLAFDRHYREALSHSSDIIK